MENPICRTVFDTRDLIEYLDEQRDELTTTFNDFHKDKDENFEEIDSIDDIIDTIQDVEGYAEFLDEYDGKVEEYKNLKYFTEELESNSSDYEYGEAVIHEDYFTDYAEEFIRDCGYINGDLPPIIENNIDWAGIAEDLKADYYEVEYERELYYIRS